MVGATSHTKQIRVRDDAEGFVVLDDASLIVPFGYIVLHESAELGREVESWFKDIRIFLWKSNANFSPRVLVLSSRPRHLSPSLSVSLTDFFCDEEESRVTKVRGGKVLTTRVLSKRRRSVVNLFFLLSEYYLVNKYHILPVRTKTSPKISLLELYAII